MVFNDMFELPQSIHQSIALDPMNGRPSMRKPETAQQPRMSVDQIASPPFQSLLDVAARLILEVDVLEVTVL